MLKRGCKSVQGVNVNSVSSVVKNISGTLSYKFVKDGDIRFR